MRDYGAAPWVQALQPYAPGKPIEELEREYGVRDSIKLASNENPLGPSPRALAAMAAALGELHRYPDGSAHRLRHAVAAHHDVSPDAVLLGNGSNELIELLVRALMQPGQHAVAADGAFVIYRMAVQAQGGRTTCPPLRDFTHDLDAMAAAVTPETRLVFVANPNNPTGTIVFADALEQFRAALPPAVLLVLDEAYAEYVDDPRYPDGPALLRGGANVVVLRTFSKAYGLAGLRVGYALADPALVALVNRIRAPFNVNTVAQVAARAALDDTDHVTRSRAVNRQGRAYLCDALAARGLTCVPSWANFVLAQVGDGAAVYEALLHEGVIVRPMGGYGMPEHVRITVGTAAENERLVTALDRIGVGRGPGG